MIIILRRTQLLEIVIRSHFLNIHSFIQSYTFTNVRTKKWRKTNLIKEFIQKNIITVYFIFLYFLVLILLFFLENSSIKKYLIKKSKSKYLFIKNRSPTTKLKLSNFIKRITKSFYNSINKFSRSITNES